MKSLHPVTLVFLAVLLPATSAGAVEGPGGERLLAGLQDWLDGSSTLSGRFEQSLVSGAFGEGIVESGRLFVRRPGKMRWDYTDPEPKTAILDGETTLFYEEEARQMVIGSLDDGGGLLAALLAGRQRLDELFRAEQIVRPELSEGRGWFLRLVPNRAEEAFEEVTLFLGRKYQLRAVEVLDASGNRVLYRFSDLIRNGTLPEGIFDFRPPEGTEIHGGPAGD